MILTLDDYLMGRIRREDMPVDHQQNASILLRRLNRIIPVIERDTGRDIKLNDGYRRLQDQPRNAAKRSRHLTAQAADLDDDDSAWLWKWCLANLRLIYEVAIFMEDPRYTHGSVGTWCHFQSVPPASGRRIFIPSSADPSAPDLWSGDYPPAFNMVMQS